jgi:hypothetical protein
MLEKIQMEVNFSLLLLTPIGLMENMLYSEKLDKGNKLLKLLKLLDQAQEDLQKQ